MRVRIIPNKLKGDVVIPPSKSLAHRAIIAGSLADGKSTITNLNFSNDITVTTQAMKDLGVDIEIFEDYEVITGSKNLKRINDTINCGESGSTIRFMIPISLLADGEVTFVGEGRLTTRPLNIFHEIFDKQGIKYSHGVEELPLTIDGKLKSGKFEVRGDISSQFITGLLYTLPKLDGNSEIIITTNLESKGYIDLTLDILDKFGIKIINENYEKFIVPGNQGYKAHDYRVEGDFSQVAFWLVAGFLNDGINCLGMNPESLQGDSEIIKILKDMGGDLTVDEDIINITGKKSNGATIDLSQCPDLGPIVTVLASLSEGITYLINAGRLRIKESDRITSMTTELNKLGAKIVETENGMIIEGVKNLKGGVEVDAWNDHRVAMALAVASSRCDEPIILIGADSVKKSYPNFWKDFESLGGKIQIIEE
ncbi:MAG: 3-phosphoshikimate 1-carboxyvinyltransferase [Fusobacteriia bacterium 4572_74]|nr:MAG: 3-phosphoshikimate 1-carboxyvinyltransferase [Fusobacteriia bacterium 4572_74]